MVLEIMNTNFVAMIICTILNMALGMLWYSPMLFGNIWMKESGWSEKELKSAKNKGMAASYFQALVLSFISFFILAQFIIYTGAFTFADGMKLGLMLWIGLVAPVMYGSVLWEKKSFKYFLINSSYYLVSFCVGAGILAVW